MLSILDSKLERAHLLPRKDDRIQALIEYRRTQYQGTFESETGKFVLGDLFHLCHAGRSTYEGDKESILINEGKRQVWLHITSMLNMDDSDLIQLAQQRRQAEFNQMEYK